MGEALMGKQDGCAVAIAAVTNDIQVVMDVQAFNDGVANDVGVVNNVWNTTTSMSFALKPQT